MEKSGGSEIGSRRPLKQGVGGGGDGTIFLSARMLTVFFFLDFLEEIDLIASDFLQVSGIDRP